VDAADKVRGCGARTAGRAWGGHGGRGGNGVVWEGWTAAVESAVREVTRQQGSNRRSGTCIRRYDGEEMAVDGGRTGA
jgi:hypothetical protein